jgi:hypothetical protein
MKSLESLTDNDVNGGLWLMEGPQAMKKHNRSNE